MVTFEVIITSKVFFIKLPKRDTEHIQTNKYYSFFDKKHLTNPNFIFIFEQMLILTEQLFIYAEDKI